MHVEFKIKRKRKLNDNNMKFNKMILISTNKVSNSKTMMSVIRLLD